MGSRLMSVLSGAEIRERLEAKSLDERLVLSPLLEIDEQIRPDQASADVRLGFEFAFVAPSSFGVVDELSSQFARTAALAGLSKRQYIPFGSCLAIHPHQFLLATTLEYLRLPSDLMAYVVGRSTWGRLGLIVATAIGIHPLFAGTLTLELRNLGETPLELYPGQAIAQLFFHSMERGDGKRESERGQYIGATDLIPRTLSSERSLQKLHGLRRRKIT
jgi:dCTP deaminase